MSRYAPTLMNNTTVYNSKSIQLSAQPLTNIRSKTVNLPTLESLHITERAENMYAQIIAEEDIGEDYGTKAIIQEGLSIPWEHIL